MATVSLVYINKLFNLTSESWVCLWLRTYVVICDCTTNKFITKLQYRIIWDMFLLRCDSWLHLSSLHMKIANLYLTMSILAQIDVLISGTFIHMCHSHCNLIITYVTYNYSLFHIWLDLPKLATYTHNDKECFSVSVYSSINKLTNYCNTNAKGWLPAFSEACFWGLSDVHECLGVHWMPLVCLYRQLLCWNHHRTCSWCKLWIYLYLVTFWVQ